MVNNKKAYLTLNLSQGATELEIKKSYRKLSLRYHPEKNNNSPANQSKWQEIQAAYELLISEQTINYQINFGVSEAEIEKFFHEELAATFASPELKNSLDLKQITAAIASKEN